MTIATTIDRLYPGLDVRQREVVSHTNGPLLVVAGPGSGKTRCIEARALNLLLREQARPAEVLLCAFGRDAAGELRRRFTAASFACGRAGAFSAVRITTIHSLCHRILEPRAGLAGLKAGYGLLDEQEQRLLLRRESGRILGPDRDALSERGWRGEVRAAGEAARHFDRICDESIDPQELARSGTSFGAALGRCLLRYRQFLLERNAVDYAHLQVWAQRVLEHKEIAEEIGGTVRHIMVDEFQDTSYIQLRILERLAGVHGNIVAVGDDDQSIYRFRGASVANLLEFPRRFPGCRVVELDANYRSHPGIVAACSAWMDTAADWTPPAHGTGPYRFGKRIRAHDPGGHPVYPSVIAVAGRDSGEECRRLGDLLRFLRSNGVITRYGQAALLLHSVMDSVSGPYLRGLAAAGIPVRCEPAGHTGGAEPDEVLVTTIHQAKGREWDVVIVGSLATRTGDSDRVGRALAGHCRRPLMEPLGRIDDFDRARRHYVAFSRARGLLVLTASGAPLERFTAIWEGAARWPDLDLETLSRQRFVMPEAAGPDCTVDIGHLKTLWVWLGVPDGAGPVPPDPMPC